jgi:hypothetical protein
MPARMARAYTWMTSCVGNHGKMPTRASCRAPSGISKEDQSDGGLGRLDGITG